MKFNNTFSQDSSYLEVNNEPSLTVPDQSLTVQEILDRFTRRLPTPHTPNLVYSDDDFPDIRTLDLAEIQQLREDNLNEIKALEQEVDRRRKEELLAQKQQLHNQIKQDVNNIFSEKQQQNTPD